MSEHDLYGPLTIGANADGMKLYRIHDGGGANPFDIGGICACGTGVAIEVKVTDTVPGAINWKRFQSQQIIWLKAFAETGALSLVVMKYRKYGIVIAIRMKSVEEFEPGWIPNYNQQGMLIRQSDGTFHGLRNMCPNCVGPIL